MFCWPNKKSISSGLALSPDGHSYSPSHLLQGGWALDIGCRGFEFTECMLNHGLHVLAVDPDVDVQPPPLSGVRLVHVALVAPQIAAKRHSVRLFKDGEPGEYNIITGDASRAVWVPCTSILQLMRREHIPFFEVVKLDCEGAEYSLLDAWPGQIAAQLSIEFHDFLGFNPAPSPERYHGRLLRRLRPWYVPVKHRMEQPAWLSSPAYVDCLFILRTRL